MLLAALLPGIGRPGQGLTVYAPFRAEIYPQDSDEPIERHSLAACSTSPLPHPLSPEMPAAPSGYASPTVLAVSRPFGDSYIYLFFYQFGPIDRASYLAQKQDVHYYPRISKDTHPCLECMH